MERKFCDRDKLVKHKEAISTYKTARENGTRPSASLLLDALKACGCLKLLDTGTALLHEYMIESRRPLKPSVWNALLCMYIECGDLTRARSVLNGQLQRDAVSWNSLMFGYVQHGEAGLALETFSHMQLDGCAPNAHSFVAALKACATAGGRERANMVKWTKFGLKLHSQAEATGHVSNMIVANTLVHMYTKCGSLQDATLVFDSMKRRDVVSWTALISGFAETVNGAETAVEFFSRMQTEEGLEPNSVTLLSVFKACAAGAEGNNKSSNLRWLEKGMAIHSHSSTSSGKLFHDMNLLNSLVNMYAKCGSLEDACMVFERMTHRNVVSWNGMMFGYVDSGEFDTALKLFARMQEEGVIPDSLSFVAALKACASCASREPRVEQDVTSRFPWLEKTFAIHAEVTRAGVKLFSVIVGSNLVQAYAKGGSLWDARRVFDGLGKRSLVTWNTMINAYAEAEQAEMALELFFRLKADRDGFKADAATYVAVLKACGSLGDLMTGRSIHNEIQNSDVREDQLVRTSLVDFYGKCGTMEEAQEVFDSMTEKDLVAWCALLGGYSLHGKVNRVLELFQTMVEQRLEMNAVVFLHVLTACSHAGLVDKGKHYFDLMTSKFSISPSLKHYTCLVDLLGRANRLEDALRLVRTMPWKPDFTIWTTVMASSHKWRNATVGRIAFEELVKMNRQDSTAYVLLAGV